MKTFQEFIQIINEKRGDYGSGVKPSRAKCGPEGTLKYKTPEGTITACKFHRKR